MINEKYFDMRFVSDKKAINFFLIDIVNNTLSYNFISINFQLSEMIWLLMSKTSHFGIAKVNV